MRRVFITLLVLLTATPVVAGDAAATGHEPPMTFAPMLKRVATGVVTVFSSRTLRTTAAVPSWIGDDPILRHFFGIEPSDLHPRKQQGLGSGVVVRADGYILTNNHVIDGADEITVSFADAPDEFRATVVGADSKTDVAVLKIDAPGRTLAPIGFGDSSSVEVGQLVFAIGNPFGVGQTVTMGIVSAVGRGVGIADYEDFLQTDASINPGNSGGALVDSTGKLVGINTAIISPTGANLGIGFAVPVSLARGIMTSIIASGKVVRGYLGVMIQPLTPALARKLALPSEDGALVTEVSEHSPAASAGFQPADVITSVNGTTVEDARHLRLTIAQLAPGSTVTVQVIRDGKHQQLTATLLDLADSDAAPASVHAITDAPPAGAHGPLGIHIDDLDDQARHTFHVPVSIAGALISEVAAGSAAEAAGVKPGMVVTGIERKPVHSAEESATAIDAANGDVLMSVWYQGGRMYLVVPRG